MEVLNLESLLDMDEGTVSLGQQEGGGDELQGEETTNPPLHLIHDPEAVFSLNELITLKMMQTSKTNSSSSSSDSINAVIYGPILLAWSCILNKLGLIMDLSGCPPSYHRIRDAMSGRQLGLLHNHGGNSSSSLGQVLVERAYQLDVIPQLTACFKSACYSDEDDNSLGYSSVMKGEIYNIFFPFPSHQSIPPPPLLKRSTQLLHHLLSYSSSTEFRGECHLFL